MFEVKFILTIECISVDIDLLGNALSGTHLL